MNTVTALPQEILRNIFSYLKREDDDYVDLQQCALTCRDWRQSAQETMFHTVIIFQNNSLDIIANILEHSPSMKRYIKVVEYPYLREKVSRHRANLEIISKSFPLVEKIRYAPLNRTMMSSLSSLILSDEFPYLSELSIPASSQCIIDYYVSCLKHLKDQISSIELCEDNSSSNTYILLGNLSGTPLELN